MIAMARSRGQVQEAGTSILKTSSAAASVWGDLFSSFFSGGAGRSATVKREGRDMGVGLRVTLEEVAAGVKKEIIYDRLSPCPECSGTGLGEDGAVACPECHGRGRVVTVQHTFLGDMQAASTCSNCQGARVVIENPCPECDGQGRVPDRQRLSVISLWAFTMDSSCV